MLTHPASTAENGEQPASFVAAWITSGRKSVGENELERIVGRGGAVRRGSFILSGWR